METETKSIADVMKEFNDNNFPNLRCEVQDEGAETPIYIVENRNCLRVAEMQDGMVEIFRYKQFTPDFMVTVGNLFKTIFDIQEVENES